MPLQNRVHPSGGINAVPARGLFTGNRGVIHDPATRTLLKRRWTTKAWIVCALAHPRARARDVMGRNAPSGGPGWTELFFLDEVTALAAGHRPCFYCRREAARAFKRAWSDGHGKRRISTRAMDEVLHRQRLGSGGAATRIEADTVGDLPDGAMIEAAGKVFAMRAGMVLPWRFGGYGEPRSADRAGPGPVTVITPAATLAVLAAGYRPVWHPSAGT